jgi:beta-lactamase regulating signal transducer with metallopeptidase domain
MNALINGSILSLPLTAAVWLALRLLPRRSLSAAARCIVWWMALLGTLALPAAYLPQRISSRPISLATPPAQIEAPVFVPLQTARIAPMPPAHSPFPIRISAGSWTRGIAITWAISALLMLARLILSCFTLLRRKRASQPIEIAIPLPRHARAMLSTEVPAPMAVGFLRPAILLPARFFDQLTPDQIEQIVLHESAHLARRDDYALVLQRAIEAAFALHPAVRFIARQLDLEREIACDDRVVEVTHQATSYAACLTRVAEMSGRISFAAAAFSQNRSQLSRRVDMLLDQARTTRTRLLKTRLAFVAVMLTALAWTLAKAPTLLAFSTPSPVSQVTSRPAPIPVEPAKPQPAPKLLAQAVRPPAPAPAPTPPASQPASIVVLPVQVTTPEGASVNGLTRDDFTILEDGVLQPITYFAIDDTPTLYGVVAMSLNAINLRMRDNLAAINGWDRVEYIQPPDPFTWQLAAERGLARLREFPNPRKVLLLLGAPAETQGLPDPPDVSIVRTGEGLFLPFPNAVRSSSYVLGYPSQGSRPDGKYVHIKVTVDQPNVMVRFRSGYYVTDSQACSNFVQQTFSVPATTLCH